jgi:hypothetical protein
MGQMASPAVAVLYKEPPRTRQMASLILNTGSEEEELIAPTGSEMSGPVASPPWNVNDWLRTPIGNEREPATASTVVPPLVIPPPPPYPAAKGTGLPAGIALPKAGTRAAVAELEKIGEWEPESRPNGQGIVKPKPRQAELDFLELISTFLLLRGLNETFMKYAGMHNGWLEYRLMCPAIHSPEAQLVADHWDDETRWPSNWVSAYHGSRWYALWNICTEGYIHVSVKSPCRRRYRPLLCS